MEDYRYWLYISGAGAEDAARLLDCDGRMSGSAISATFASYHILKMQKMWENADALMEAISTAFPKCVLFLVEEGMLGLHIRRRVYAGGSLIADSMQESKSPGPVIDRDTVESVITYLALLGDLPAAGKVAGEFLDAGSKTDSGIDLNSRDPKRIDAFCDRLKAVWHTFPDLRFGQLMVNVLGEMQKKGRDPFFPEDGEMMAFLESYAEEHGKTYCHGKSKTEKG